MSTHYDLAVIGAGSGGFAAALAGARLGLRTLLVEKADTLGGNAVRCGVNIWEMGAGGTGIPFDLYRRLKRQTIVPPHWDSPQPAVAIYSYGRHMCWPLKKGQSPFPGGEQVIDPDRRYIDSLRRHGTQGLAADEASVRELWHGVPFEPDACHAAMVDMLRETECCTVVTRTAFTQVHHHAGRITAMELDDGRTITADAWIDGTADGLLCLACGCESVIGQESSETYHEPDAPPQANRMINGVSLIYRVKDMGKITAQPALDGDDLPDVCWWRDRFPVVSSTQYPCGDRNMNPLPIMEGHEFLNQPYADAYRECTRRIRAQWRWIQNEYPEFRNYIVTWIAPGAGVRESQRIVGQYVLTQHDLLASVTDQPHDDIICIADHAMDTHGQGNRRGGCGELKAPYGVPFRCLIPKGFSNLLIACRAASFSSIAASSCRLSRTMMQLGQAAGTAAAIAKKANVDVSRSPPAALRESLASQHVQLTHPMTDAQRHHLLDESAP